MLDPGLDTAHFFDPILKRTVVVRATTPTKRNKTLQTSTWWRGRQKVSEAASKCKKLKQPEPHRMVDPKAFECYQLFKGITLTAEEQNWVAIRSRDLEALQSMLSRFSAVPGSSFELAIVHPRYAWKSTLGKQLYVLRSVHGKMTQYSTPYLVPPPAVLCTGLGWHRWSEEDVHGYTKVFAAMAAAPSTSDIMEVADSNVRSFSTPVNTQLRILSGCTGDEQQSISFRQISLQSKGQNAQINDVLRLKVASHVHGPDSFIVGLQ